MGKHIERTAQTKQALLDAFWKLYCENKIEKITVKAVTDEAGFYRSTFYEYFSDVYEMLEEIESDILARHRQAMEEIFSSKDMTSAQSRALAFCMENIEQLAILLGPKGDPKFRTLIKDHICKAMKELLHVDASEPAIQVTIEVFSGAVISLMLYWYENQDTISLPEVFALGMQIMQNGLFSMMQNLDIPFLKE